MICPICGHNNRSDAQFCQKCGEVLTSKTNNKRSRSTQGNPKPDSHTTLSQNLPDTRPLTKASPSFAPLPKGALLNAGHYEIIEKRISNKRLNIYLVKETEPVRLCPNCRQKPVDSEERFCAYCGADLSDAEEIHLRYLVQESSDGHAFQTEAKLLQLSLDHPALLPPHDFFEETPYGTLSRRYLVEAEYLPPRATTLSVPQELNKVLQWGIDLAQALGCLHQHNVTLQGAGIKHIALEKETAYWVDLGVAQVTPPTSSSETESYFAQDIQGLANALLYLATGQRAYQSDLPLPDQAANTLSKASRRPAQYNAASFTAALEAALENIQHPENVTLSIGRHTDVGRERSLNEDSLLTLEFVPIFRSVSEPIGLFIVADGMGGHEAGDIASQLTIRTVAKQATDEIFLPAASGDPLPPIDQWLTSATRSANRAVYDQRSAAGNDMGTTLVMALVIGNVATIANVGDSRAYLLQQEGIEQITTDHSLVERLIATGQITPEEAADHPQRNVIYRVIGDKTDLEVDLIQQPIQPDEALLLCSDGLSGMMNDEVIWQIWRTSTSPQEACNRLVAKANQEGGEDNITVVIVQIQQY